MWKYSVPSRAQQPMRFLQARSEKREVVLEAVPVAGAGEHLRAVAATLKPGPPAGRVAHHAQRPALLQRAGVERRVDVDQLKRRVGERRQQLEVLAEEDRGRPPGIRWRGSRTGDYGQEPTSSTH